jgi:hypothetical protein
MASLAAHASAQDAKTAIGAGLGAAAGTAIGESMGGKTGSIVGGAVGGAAGGAVSSDGRARSGAMIGAAVGGASGAAVGHSVGGSTGAVVGAGVGGAGLALAARVPDARVNLVEIDPATVEFARANSAHNGLETRLSVVEADLLASHAERSLNGLTREDAACVITNPPFLSEGEARPSSDEDRRRAHLMPTGGLERWMRAIHALLAPRGTFVMITRPER